MPSALFHIIANTVFLRLADVASGLPDYTEQILLSSMDSEEDATGYSQRSAYDTLPLRYTASTPCFRREKAAAGRDTRGIKRVHQFQKVEMYKFVEPQTSDQELDGLVADAAIVPKAQFNRVAKLMRSRAPKIVNPRRVASPFLLSGLVKCKTCRRALTGQYAKSGQFPYYVCQTLMKQGSGSCDTPRLNARRFEKLVVEKIRSNILTEGNIRDLVKTVDEKMDGVAAEQHRRLEAIDVELEDVKRHLSRIWHFIGETDNIDMADAGSHIRELRDRQEVLEGRGIGGQGDLDTAQVCPGRREHHRGLRQGNERLPKAQRTDRAQGLHPVVRQGDRRHPGRRPPQIHRAYAKR